MRIAVHQVQFLPGPRFFHKMAHCDLFVYLDDVQYEKREFQNRNKIRTKDGWQYLTVPVLVKGKFTQKINGVEINNTYDWHSEHLKAIKLNYSKAKYFKEYFAEIEKIYSSPYSKLVEISLETINFFRKCLKIETPTKFSSEFDIKTSSTAKLVDLCKKAGADEYFSGLGGKDYLDEKLFEKNNIKLTYQDFKYPQYPQVFDGFQSDLSCLDLLLNCGPQSLKFI
jgi:hypothetical protein